MDWIFLTSSETWLSLITLTVLEIVLGIDNIIFISVVSSRLPVKQQPNARRIGLAMALITRLLLLAAISWITRFTVPIFTLAGQSFSGRDLILIGGGLFLLAKATSEIHLGVVAAEEGERKITGSPRFFWVVVQIMFLDIIFSLDSIITAVGMTRQYSIMAMAIIIAVILMLFASEPLSRIIYRYPSIKMLALSFLLLVGVVLIADGFEFHVPRQYLYFAIAFSIFVEVLNILAGRRSKK